MQQTLRAHFEREEAALERIVRFGGHPEALESLTELWREHTQLNADMASLRESVGATEPADSGGRPLAEVRRQLDGEIQSLDARLAAHTRREGLLFPRGKALLGAQ